MTINFKRLHPDAILPTVAHPGDAGHDLYSVEDVEIPAGGRAGVGIGWAIEFPHGYVARILGRSGLAIKYGVSGALAGVIDASYRGEWKVILVNLGQEAYVVNKGDRIAQAVFFPVVIPTLVEVDELSESDRAVGGFGSTGR